MHLSPEMRARAAALVQRDGRPVTAGRVQKIIGLGIEASVSDARMGDLVEVEGPDGPLPCKVVGFRDGLVLAIPLGERAGIRPGAAVHRRAAAAGILVGPELLGRLIDSFGNPLDGLPPPRCRRSARIDAPAPSVVDRAPVSRRFDTGVRVIDGLLTCGRGQRIGIFAGAGVGKSVLVEQIARQAEADVTVVGLIGERGREVRELLSSEHRSKMVIVAATSDRSPMERERGAKAATAVAEHFRDQGANVLLVIDSLTRYAMALREIGLSIGEPPATKGYPPSVFATLPLLLERVAPLEGRGSITGFYTVLVEGDDMSDPVADSARSLLDAHLVLSREQASRDQFPAVDVLASASRVARQVTDKTAHDLMQRAREALSQRKLVQELQSLGAYTPGTNPGYDQSLSTGRRLDEWARQAPDVRSDYSTTMTRLTAALEPA
ncbi:MAG TPA: FliI/YscN family ATPase [Kofleriaceae bacterium]|nr:FliI/YscN family ATPase [Kofleriaceae bacterium]